MISLAAALSSLASSSEGRIEEALADLAEAQKAYTTLRDDQLAERIYVLPSTSPWQPCGWSRQMTRSRSWIAVLILRG